MTRLILALPLAAALLAPADAAGAGPADGPVAEIVTFRLVPGVTEAEFLGATHAMTPALSRAPGFVSRRLSRRTDGTWTDHVVWTDLASAEAAAQEVFRDPATRAFAAAIDGATIDMRHEPILLTME
jgi:hypothetical protein